MKRKSLNRKRGPGNPSEQDWFETMRSQALEALAHRRDAYHQLSADLIADDADTARFIAQLKVHSRKNLHEACARKRHWQRVASIAASFIAITLAWQVLRAPDSSNQTLARHDPLPSREKSASTPSPCVVVTTAEADPRLRTVHTFDVSGFAITRTGLDTHTTISDSELPALLFACGVNAIGRSKDGYRICRLMPSGQLHSLTL